MRKSGRIVIAGAVFLAAVTFTACSVTKQAPVEQSTINCAFLGASCANLTPGKDGQAKFRYFAPGVQWTQYHSVILDPVTYWAGEKDSLSSKDQQTITNYFHQELEKQLQTKFKVVTTPQPDAIRIQVAVVNADTATPILRSFSMIIPQAHVLATLKDLATGSFPFAGSAQAELKMTDSMTGAVLGEAVDRRVGGGAFRAGFQWQWGDAENAVDAWSKELVEKLSTWTSGTATP